MAGGTTRPEGMSRPAAMNAEARFGGGLPVIGEAGFEPATARPQPEDTTAICVRARPMRPIRPRLGTHRTDRTMRPVPNWYHAHPPDEANQLGRAAVDKIKTAAPYGAALQPDLRCPSFPCMRILPQPMCGGLRIFRDEQGLTSADRIPTRRSYMSGLARKTALFAVAAVLAFSGAAGSVLADNSGHHGSTGPTSSARIN